MIRRGVRRETLVVAGSAVALFACTPYHGVGNASAHVSAGTQVERPGVSGGRLRFAATDDATGRDLPIRVTVRGVDGTPDPSFGVPSRAAGAGVLVVAPSGHGEVAIPPGHYSVTFSHGPEWSVDRVRADVSADVGATVQGALHHVIPMDDWTACDFHVHAAPSLDSQVSIQDRVAALVVEGVEFATPTEHNVIGDYTAGVRALPSAASSAQGGPGLAWVPAVEITTDAANNPIGHFNAFPYQPDPHAERGGPPPADRPPAEIFRAVRAHSRDAIIQVNHPRMNGLGYFDLTQLDPATNRAASPLYDPSYDVIEVYNGFFLRSPVQVDAVLHDWFALLATGAHYVGTANSDSHVIAYNQAGYPRTYVFTPGAGDRAPDSESLLRSLRAAHAFGTSGPMLFVRAGDAIEGDTVRTSTSDVTLHVRVMAAPWIAVDRVEIYRNGVLATTVPVPAAREPLRLDTALTLPITEPHSFFVVIARGDEPLDLVLPNVDARPMAFTNPIWVEQSRP
jgi:hypothetical protein